MENMINNDLVKELRSSRKWSQGQLSFISGLSLRTVQRIENNGRCSQDSQKALAAAFEIDANEFDIDLSQDTANRLNNRGRKFGLAGAIGGLLCAYIGIFYSVIMGGLSYSEAGIYSGFLGAFCGICCAVVGLISNKQTVNKIL